MLWPILIAATFYTLCLCLVLILLWLIWHDSVTRMLKVQQSLIELAVRNAESVQQSIDLTRALVESVHVLVNIIQTQQKDDADDAG